MSYIIGTNYIHSLLKHIQTTKMKILLVPPKYEVIMVTSNYWFFFSLMPLVKLLLLIFFASFIVSGNWFFTWLLSLKCLSRSKIHKNLAVYSFNCLTLYIYLYLFIFVCIFVALEGRYKNCLLHDRAERHDF